MFKLLPVLFFLFAGLNNSFAQLCQGSLGDPIVNVSFGAGSNPGPPLTAATTSYQYVSTDCPGDGYYAVRNNTSSCFGNSWFTLNGDHTGDAGGYFMLVNASFQPSAFYLDTVRGLCASTTYEFAAWIMNVIYQSCNGGSIEPNLTFQIEKTDGTILQTYNSGNIPVSPAATWKQYGFFFTTPAGISDVVLRIINNSPGGCGNDLALDDITFRPCGPLLTASITGVNSDTVSTCEGIALAFSFNSSISAGFTNPSFQWQQNIATVWTDIPGATNTSYSGNLPANTAAGTYLYRVTVAEAGNISIQKCRVASKALSVRINTNPVTTATANSPVCEGSNLILTATGGVQYAWTGVNNFSASGSPATIAAVQLSQGGKYYVEVTNAAGCKHHDSTFVFINPSPVANTAFATINICSGDSIQLMATGGGTYLWSPSVGLSSTVIAAPKASPATNTDYMVIVTNQLNCTDTAYTVVNVVNPPTADAGPDRSVIAGRSVQLLANAQGINISNVWTPSLFINDANVLRPMVNPPYNMNYILTVTSADGCGVISDTVSVEVYKDVFVPNAFSPNNDGINDRWVIPALNAFSTSEITVFNRYGQIVYRSINNNGGWDGKYKGTDLSEGTYCYIINIKDLPLTLTGNVIILR